MPNFDQNQFRVYVQKMPGNATDYMLKDHFSKFGEVRTLCKHAFQGPRLGEVAHLVSSPWSAGFLRICTPPEDVGRPRWGYTAERRRLPATL